MSEPTFELPPKKESELNEPELKEPELKEPELKESELKESELNRYKCHWRNHWCEVDSDTSYHAQQLAVVEFSKFAGRRQKVRPSDISVMLCRKAGEDRDIVHTPDF